MKEEFNVLIETMEECVEECGLIERIGDTVQLTEKGKEFSELREGLKELIEVQKNGEEST
ncbi:MAG: hypothetical protein HXS54_05810 [Theionarchaea archaeon]|nr:hypothetical protein [Theionarchaea archaeon]